MDQQSLLNKGLNYVPTNTLDHFEFVKDFNKLCRKIRAKIFFSDKEYQQKTTPHVLAKLKARSTFDPPIKNSTVETFQQLVTQEVTKKWEALSRSAQQQNNISRKERIALKVLQADESLTLKKADKGGGAIVVMDSTLYIDEAKKQLLDEKVYLCLNSDPTIQYKKEIDDIIEEACSLDLITIEIKKALINDHPRVPILNLVPKVHKNLKTPPGRPIVSSVGSILQSPATYVDSFLQKIVTLLPGCLKDTTQFLKETRQIDASEVMLMGTLDIKSLFTNIPFLEGFKAVQEQLCLLPQLSNRDVGFLMSLLEVILTRNYFRFGDDFYLQHLVTPISFWLGLKENTS